MMITLSDKPITRCQILSDCTCFFSITSSQKKKKSTLISSAMSGPNTTTRRILSIQRHTAATSNAAETLVVVLPTGSKVTSSSSTNSREATIHLFLDRTPLISYRSTPLPSLAFEISSVGTQFEGATEHIPKYSVLELSQPRTGPAQNVTGVTIPDFWAAVYALFTLYRTQEHIPVIFPTIPNGEEVSRYLISSGLGRRLLGATGGGSAEPTIFLSRAAFWQGAGTTEFHRLGWIASPKPVFPIIPSFTRTATVITAHPLRPPKPLAGEVLYRRWCAGVGQTLDFTYFDLDGTSEQNPCVDGVSRHLAAFHKWHNDKRVSNAWGETGSLEEHREYLRGVTANPGVLPYMMSWDGELMGYLEVVWVKENHVAQYYPPGVVVGEWERGIHVLVGEEKFLGGGRCKSSLISPLVTFGLISSITAEIWLRSLIHALFLADSRTDRVAGEPKQNNIPMVKTAVAAGFQIQTVCSE